MEPDKVTRGNRYEFREFLKIHHQILTQEAPKVLCSTKPVHLVPRAGLEPARPEGHKILSLACLPIPPPRHKCTCLFREAKPYADPATRSSIHLKLQSSDLDYNALNCTIE